MAVISTKPNKNNISVKERNIEETNESFSSPLVNYVESNEIDGNQWTRFYTRVDTNLKVGDKVFIVNGNYDSYNLILNYEYSKGSTGYNILEINATSITLDIEYSGTLPWNQDPFDDYIKIYASDNILRTVYEVQQSKYYPYKYIYGYRGNNNILFSSAENEFRVADSTNYTTFSDWIDVTSDLLSNNFGPINGNNITPNNGKLLIMDSFTYNNKGYEEGFVYKYNGNEWIKDNNQRKAFLSKSNFRNGSFDGTFNDGIFGNIDNKITWNSGRWRNGILFNSIWDSGIMESKSDSINKANHYASLEDGEVKQITDFNNNDTFGYNFSFNSQFNSGVINNINSDRSTVGNYTNSDDFVNRYLTNPNGNFNFDLTLNGRWLNSHIENVLINSGLYEFSDIENSLSTDGRFSDTDIEYCVISGKMEGMGKIDILDSEKLFTAEQYIEDDPFSSSTYNNLDNLIVNYKFYISEKSYQKIKAGSEIYLNDIITSSSDILNFFNNNFYLGVDQNGDTYLTDNYGQKREVAVQLNSKKQNDKKRILTNGEFPLQEIDNSIKLPSIDIFIHLPNGFTTLNFDLTSYLNGSTFDKNYRQDITNVTDTTLQIGKFKKSIFNGGEWEASKVNNPDYQIKRIGGTSSNYLQGTFSGTDLTLTLDNFTGIFENDQIKVGDIVYLSNISYDTGGNILEVDGTYSVTNYNITPDLEVTLEDFGSQSIAGSYSPGGDFISSFIVDNGTYSLSDSQDTFNSIHFEKIQNTEISRGFIKRELLINDMFENGDFVQQTELDIRNVNLLKISEVILTDSNNIEANSGLFIHTFIRDNDWDDGIIYKSVLKDLIFNDGIIKNSRWLSGTFNGGQFVEGKRSVISDTNDLSQVFTNIDIRSEWLSGDFNGGEFFDSIWTSGTFNGGKFYNSIFAAGEFNDGVFGDSGFSNESNKFGDATQTHRSVNVLGNSVPVWNNGTFNKGEFGLKSPNSDGEPSPLIDDIIWNDGMFNDGRIVSYSPTSSVIWNDGTFNNGDIIGYVQWEDGTFNNGRFRSSWGTGYGTQSSNYAWKDGIFNGGRFGEPEGTVTVSLDGDTTYRNPSWFNGRFNNGQFMGKIWNDGIFTGGRFMGNKDSTFPSNKNRETFPNSFDVDGSQLVNLFQGDLGQWKIGDVEFGDLGGFEHVGIESSSSFSGGSNPYSVNFYPVKAIGGSNLVFNSTFFGNRYWMISPNIDYEVEKITLSYGIKLESVSTSISMTASIYIEGEDQQGNTYSFIDEEVNESIPDFSGTNYELIKSDFLTFNSQVSTVENMKYKISVDFEFDNGNWTDAYFKVDDIDFVGTEKNKISSIPDQFVMDYSHQSNVDFYGMWRNGEVISDNTVAVGESNFVKLSKVESVKRFKGENNPEIFFENALWIDGEFKAFGQMDNCVWLSGIFKNGRFINSAFNPYVPRWNFNSDPNNLIFTNQSPYYSFELDDNKCQWKSGYLDKSEFSISVWENGTFNEGTMFGGLFKNGVANYINAINCIWENGIWNNGNWYGSDFTKNILFDTSFSNDYFNFIKSKNADSLVKNSIRLNSNDLFAWSIIDTSDDTIYSSNLSYKYTDLNQNQSLSLTFNNNEFLTVGSFSQIQSTGSAGNQSTSYNRLLGLNFFQKGYNGYNIQNSGLDFSDDGFYPIDVETSNGFITSMWGNGVFIKGKWEDGVWNNGPRLNQSFGTENTITFLDNVDNFFENGIDRWQIDLSSDENIPTNFIVGDYISLGNIVALTVNDDRKFLNDSYQITRINRNLNKLSVVVKVTFPIKSIEKDSSKHRIMMTNNVWEGGNFHNGRFEGVWNFGNFEGYPNITTMKNTHWIDGVLDGGKISSDPNYEDSLGRSWHDSLIQNARINIRNRENSNLSETVLDLIYNGYGAGGSNVYSHIWSSNSPLPIETTDDVLSSRTRVSLNNKIESLSLGVKFKKYGDLIQDDLDGITFPDRLEGRGWSFSSIYSGDEYPLPSNQDKFLPYQSNTPLTPSNNMVIDTFENPNQTSEYDPSNRYLIRHDNLENIIKNRYWEVSYKIVDKDFLPLDSSGTFSYINPYPSTNNSYYNFDYQGSDIDIKAYHWNFPKNSPFINLGNEVVAKIDDIKFTEIDYIPLPDIRDLDQSIDPDNTLKVPKSSISNKGSLSEADSSFIDNK